MPKRSRASLVLGTLAVAAGLGGLWWLSGPLAGRCLNVSDPERNPVKIGPLAVRAIPPVCVRPDPILRSGILIEVPLSRFEEATVAQANWDRPFEIRLLPTVGIYAGSYLNYTRPDGEYFVEIGRHRMSDGSTARGFRHDQVFTSKSLYDDKVPPPMTWLETVISGSDQTVIIRGSTNASYEMKGYRNPFVNKITLQWDPAFAAHFTMWAYDEQIEGFNERAAMLAAKVRAFVEAATEAR